MTNHHVDHAAPRRKSCARADRTGLAIPTISMPADFDPAQLTRGGYEIWRRTRRPTSTCNVIAQIANLGHEEAL